MFTCSRVFTRAHTAHGSRGGRPGLPVPISPDDLCERKVTFEEDRLLRALELRESQGGRPGPPVPNTCLLYTSPSPRDEESSRMPSSA